MKIKSGTWHARVYQWWLRHGRGNEPGYRENLCHYVRVLLFWAPMTWIDRLTDVGTWGPRTVAVLYLSMIALMAIGVLIVVPAITQTTRFLMAMGSLAGLITTLGILYGIGKFAMTHRLPRIPTLGIPTTSRLIYEYGKAKKHRICPFIEFEEA